MKLIDISTPKYPNTFTMVDDEDFDRINQWKWCPQKWGNHGSMYAIRKHRDTNKTVRMHREIMRIQDRGVEVDHINGNGLDNRSENLRACTRSQNCQNRRVSIINKSGYKGVSWHSGMKKWYARIAINSIEKCLGYYGNVEEAARAYDAAAKEIFMEFAKTNHEIKGKS